MKRGHVSALQDSEAAVGELNNPVVSLFGEVQGSSRWRRCTGDMETEGPVFEMQRPGQTASGAVEVRKRSRLEAFVGGAGDVVAADVAPQGGRSRRPSVPAARGSSSKPERRMFSVLELLNEAPHGQDYHSTDEIPAVTPLAADESGTYPSGLSPAGASGTLDLPPDVNGDRDGIAKSARLDEDLTQDEKYRRHQSETQKMIWQNEEYRRRQMERRRNLAKDEAYRARLSAARKALWQDPEYRKRVSEGRKNVCSDPEYRRKLQKAHQNLWNDPERRQKVLEARQSSNNERRRRISEAMKSYWRDPEKRKQRNQRKKVKAQEMEGSSAAAEEAEPSEANHDAADANGDVLN